MVTRVETDRTVSLGNISYPLKGRIQNVLASVYPAKVVIGDTTRDSQTRASVLAFSDWRGGIGLDKLEGAAGADRVWWSDLNLRHNKNLTLQRLAVQTTMPSSGTGPIPVIGELASEIYIAMNSTDVRKYNNTNDDWGSSLHTLPAAATDVITYRQINDDTVYLIFAHSTGYTYTSDGSSFTDDTEDIQFMTVWDDKLWGIDSTGQLRWSTTIGTWIEDAQLGLEDDMVTDLFTGRDSQGNAVIFCMTQRGLYVHAFGSIQGEPSKFVESELTLPLHPDNGKGSVRWRGNIFIPAGLSVYRYTDGSSPAVVSVVGPDRDDGIPSDKRGTIRQLVGSHNELLALIDGTSASGTQLDLFASGQSPVIPEDTGFSSILAWNDQSWQVLWVGGESDTAITAGLVSNAYSTYRLYWAQNETVYYMVLPRDIINPEQVTDFNYSSTGELFTPWFNAGQDEVNKLALEYEIEITNASSTETVEVSYAYDLDDTTYTHSHTYTSNGLHKHPFPNPGNPIGTTFRWIRFKLVLNRGSDNTKSPFVHSLTLVYRKKIPPKQGFQFDVDLERNDWIYTAKAMQKSLRECIESEVLIPLTYRPDGAQDDTIRTFYVDIVSATNTEETGLNEHGVARVTAVEP